MIIFMTPIFKVGNNISTLFYILSAIPFHYWYYTELSKKEEYNKGKGNLKAKEFFDSIVKKYTKKYKVLQVYFLLLHSF